MTSIERMLLNTEARIRRYANVDIRYITARRACTPADFDIVSDLRQMGFGRMDPEKSRHTKWVDDSDFLPGTFSLIGYNKAGQPLATLRVQDRRNTPLELERYVSLANYMKLDEFPASQFARLSAIKGEQSTDVMFGTFKAAWSWCLREGLQTIVIATPPWSKQIYDFMKFEALGPGAEFDHSMAGGAHHIAMKLPVQGAETVWKSSGMPLSVQYFDTNHPSLTI